MPYQANASALLACFYKPVKELNPRSSYRLCRNAQNPGDSSCIEVKDGTRVRATLNKDFAHLLASFLDKNTVEEPTWCISFLFSLNILNVSTLRYNKSPDKWSKIPLVSFFKLSLGRCQPRSQGLSSSHPSERGETLVGSGHVSPRIWEMTVKSLKGGAP